MDLVRSFATPGHEPIACVELHTVGMPTRIIVKGYPEISGTLAEQKAEALEQHDAIRQRILSEPRGHFDMFGAILRPHTELTKSHKAHMGVLYIHPDGYSNMCGHATIALGRFLVDTHDLEVFPQRDQLKYDPTTGTSLVVLHTPGGLVEVTVPTNSDGSRSDPTRPITFEAVPAFALTTDYTLPIKPENRWPELGRRDSINVSFAYCSAFSCQVSIQELGFPHDGLQSRPMLEALRFATSQVRRTINSNEEYRSLLKVPGKPGLDRCIFGVMVVDKAWGTAHEGTRGGETGLYFFGKGHIDRSPTGSMAAARAAVAFAKGELSIGDSWTYHSLVSNSTSTSPGLVATILRLVTSNGVSYEDHEPSARPVIVQIKGYASYTGFHTFVYEEHDHLPRKGFLLSRLE
ncbi:uncharacterized protein E0L32_002855 [Thyridium curvatum]|uniref:trans-L-3-hydroxyproline dehydratase n=1 Tax=Thyridium curvatum TaxID=1093900 RepID=A0A507BG61_9PEZI|nr:uncharacterized protein E0L32_002855 [Thyridium curvatum]TPX17754.1 hypothetical protein E0L32_002855 [Thyridium curvatum]